MGGSLKGGEDRVEEIRLALLGFRRDVGSMRSKLEGRRAEVAGLIRQRQKLRREIQVGRTLLAIDEGLQTLEESLMLERNSNEPSVASDEDDENGGEPDDDPVISKLARCTEQHAAIRQTLRGIREDHPLRAEMNLRLVKIREALLLDLTNIMKQMKDGKLNVDGLLDLAMLRHSIIDSNQLNSSLNGRSY